MANSSPDDLKMGSKEKKEISMKTVSVHLINLFMDHISKQLSKI